MIGFRILWLAFALAMAVLASGCRGYAPPRRGSPDVAAEVQRYVERLSSEDPVERAWAAWQLGELGLAAAPAVPALLALHDQRGTRDANARCYAADPDMCEALPTWPGDDVPTGELGSWEPTGPRHAALWALRHIGPAAERGLVAALSDKAATKRQLAAAALSSKTMPGAVPVLLAALSDESAPVRLAAARSLLDSTGPRVAESYRRLLSDPTPEVRQVAAGGLRRFRTPEVVDALAAALDDREIQVAGAAAKSLRGIGGRRAQDVLLRALDHLNKQSSASKHDVEPDIEFHRIPVIEALGAFQTPEVARALINAYDRVVNKYYIGKALVEMGTVAVEPLREALRRPEIRAYAAAALADLDKAGSAALIEAAQDADHDVRETAANALLYALDPQAVPVLVKLLDDPDSGIRQPAARALAFLKAPEAAPPLIRALGHPLRQRRGEAAHALGLLEDPRAVAPLIALLEDPDEALAAEAAAALANIGDARAAEPLAKFFERALAVFRARAAQPPGGTGTPAAKAETQGPAQGQPTDSGEAQDTSWQPVLPATRQGAEWIATFHNQMGEQNAEEPFWSLSEGCSDMKYPPRFSGVSLTWLGGQFLVAVDASRTATRLTELLADKHMPGRADLAETLAEIGDRRAAPVLLRILQDASEQDDVREAAALAVSRLDPAGAVEPLAAVLRQRLGDLTAEELSLTSSLFDPAVQRARNEDSARRGFVVAMAAALTRTRQPAAAKALGPFRDRRAVAALVGALEDQTDEVRLDAAWALVAIGDPSAASALGRAAAREPEAEGRRLMKAAADILVRGDAFFALVEALDSVDYDVYQRAAATLGVLGDRRAVAPLIRAYGLRHRIEWDEWFPCPTSEALARLTGADVDSHPTAWYRWWAVNRPQYPEFRWERHTP